MIQIVLSVAISTLRIISRSGSFFITSLAVWLFLLLTAYTNIKIAKQTQKQQAVVEATHRLEWDNRHGDPHAAAHWGTFLYKPITALSSFDPIFNKFTGNYYRVEAHKQQAINGVALRQREPENLLGNLSVFGFFRLIIPLLIIFVGYACVSNDRISGNLKLVFVQLRDIRYLVWGKILGLFGIVLIWVVPIMLLYLIYQYSSDMQFITTQRLFLAFTTFLLYFFVICSFVVFISSIAKYSHHSLLINISCWIVCSLLFPRIMADYADKSYPLTESSAFERDVRLSNSRGLADDGDYVERQNRYLDSLAKSKGLTSRDSLKRSVYRREGLLYSEAYLNRVYDYHTQGIEKKMDAQQSIVNVSCFLNLYIAVEQVSMSLAGNDVAHHTHFYKQARAYRNHFNDMLNQQLIDHADGREPATSFSKMPNFLYNTPSVGWVFTKMKMAVIALGFWLFFSFLLVNFSVNHLKIIRL